MKRPNHHFDLIVIGTGSAGSAGWETAVLMGKRVAVFEADVLGGECPTFACVPSKALLQSAHVYDTILGAERFGIRAGRVSFDYQKIKEFKDKVVSRTGAAQGERPYREAGVHVLRYEARFISPGEIEANGVVYTADRFLIATGTRPRIPEVGGLTDVGFLTFKSAIDLIKLPESVLIMGGGAVGCEFAQVFATFGAKVTIADRNKHLLAKEDPEVGDLLASQFQSRGLTVLNETTLVSVKRRDGKKIATLEQRGNRGSLEVEEILLATGEVPNLDLGLDRAGVEFNEKGIIVDETLVTTNPVIYAAGDCVGPYRYTHVASYQGGVASHNAFSAKKIKVDYRAVPRCVFTSPEIATVGMTERRAREAGISVRVGVSRLDSLGRANTADDFVGLVKVITDSRGKLIGGAIAAPHAGEMVHELALAITFGITADQIASVIHAFPTFSEAIALACSQVELDVDTN